MLLIEEILCWSTQRLPRGRLNTVVTALLLRTNGKEARIAFEGITRGRYKIDETFVERLFCEARPKLARLQLAKSDAFACLSPTTFKRLYLQLWRTRDSTDGWRQGLAWSLQMFLRRHPDQGHKYATMISKQMRDEVEEIALLGIFSAGYLGKALSASDAKYLCIRLESLSLKTMNALNALTEVYKRWTITPGPAQHILSSQQVINVVERLAKEDAYRCNASYCIRAMRKAIGRSSGSSTVRER